MEDWSALIFVGLAVAWAAYLLPLAIKHHDEVARSRTVDRFSDTMRVLARRDAVDKRGAQLVTPGRPAVTVDVAPPSARVSRKLARRAAREAARAAAPAELTAAQHRVRRAAAKRATHRRRNVLALLLLANLAVAGVAAFAVISWWYVAIPAGLLVAWLVTCRLMVKSERRTLAPSTRLPVEQPAEDDVVAAPEAPAPEEQVAEFDPMTDTSAGIAAVVDPAMWDPVPVTLPTYVGKPQAERRTIRTIDLESTGVWTSGRTEADAALARESDEADKAARQARRDGDDQRAVGS